MGIPASVSELSVSELNALQSMVGDRYQPLSLLGKKSGRKTLFANDLETQTQVVIKLLTFGEDFHWDDLKLFEREAETLRSLDHPAIPQYLDYFDVETPRSKGFALVQSHIEARSLAEQVAAGRRFSEEELEQIAQQLLEILDYLHSRQPAVIHRDIKPSNILLTDRTAHSVGQVYLVDFGSVQTLAAREGGTITVVGTYGYMPPEQFGGRAVPASDLYSLGAMLIYLASGRHPADLPQDELRLEFDAFVQLSPNMVAWLRALVEPSLGRRFDSVKDAIASRRSSQFDPIVVDPIVVDPIVAPASSDVAPAFPDQLPSPQLGGSIDLVQTPDMLRFSLPARGLKLGELKKSPGEISGGKVVASIFVSVVILTVLVSLLGQILTLLLAVGALIWSIHAYVAVPKLATLVISAKTIQVKRPFRSDLSFARHYAWQLRRESAGQLMLLIGTNQLRFSLRSDDTQWLSQVLSQVLQLPEEAGEKYFVGDASKPGKKGG